MSELKISDAARKVLAHPDCPPLAEEYDTPSSPAVANRREIRFNGIGEEGHETFTLEHVAQLDDISRSANDILDNGLRIGVGFLGNRRVGGLRQLIEDGAYFLLYFCIGLVRVFFQGPHDYGTDSLMNRRV